MPMKLVFLPDSQRNNIVHIWRERSGRPYQLNGQEVVSVFNISPLRFLLTQSQRLLALNWWAGQEHLLLWIRLLNEHRYSLLRTTGSSTFGFENNFDGNQLGTFHGLHFLHARKASPSDTGRAAPFVQPDGPYKHIIESLKRESDVMGFRTSRWCTRLHLYWSSLSRQLKTRYMQEGYRQRMSLGMTH